jgi:signal transduction histidine kinase
MCASANPAYISLIERRGATAFMPDAPERHAERAMDHDAAGVRSRADLELFAEVARRVSEAGLDREAILEAVSRTLSGRIGDGCCFCFSTAAGDEIVFEALSHPDPGVISWGRSVAAVGGSGKYRRSQALLDETIPAHVRAFFARRRGIRDVLFAPLYDREEVIGALVVWSDRTERTYGEGDARLLQEVAEQAARALTAARLYREALTRTQLREKILSLVSHDLRNPLNVIVMQHRVLEKQLASLDDPGLAWLLRPLERVGRAASKMSAMVGELIDVARLQAGEPLTLDRQPLDLVELAQGVIEEVRLGAHDRAIWVTAPEPTLMGRWDRARIERVIANLVSNALKYSPGGDDIEVGVARADRAEGGADAIVVVRDRGLGIPARELPYVFEWFRRASNVEGRIQGSGVGLASARMIVEQHGGSITAESREGEGSTFTVRLPL